MELPKVYNSKEIEEKIYNLWLKTGFFNPDKLPPRHKKPYCIALPPPNITGELHMGHGLNALIQDILIRWKRMQGFKTLWLPGTDHAGIATQNVVEKQLKKEGLSRFDLDREKFIERVWQWVKKHEDIIIGQFKKMGVSCDWSRKRFTLDKGYIEAVENAFFHYYKKGWIYRGKRVVNWCQRCQTSLSDLEIEYAEEKGKLWYIKYPLVKNSKLQIPNFLVVATTRPETMLGDTAVAVNPGDKRYKNLIGQKAILPLVNREIPIIVERVVDPKFGSGVVKITPAHDLIDYEISLKHKLPIIQVIDEEAKITKEAPIPYQGLEVLEARKKVVEDLKERGLLEKIEDYFFSVPKCYRCQTTLESIPSEQWFLKMEKLAKLAIEVVKKKKVKFRPQSFEKGYFDWLKNIKDWCISRQIWWGHQLPVWFCQREGNSKLKEFISLKKPKKCPICRKCQPERVSDVLDTWFSSALWPFAALNWPKKAKSDLDRFYPTDLISTDRGIINLWVARMIFSGIEFMGKPPFKDVYIHATVLTREGERMSKSLGTGIDPISLIEKYGADATRWGLSWQIMGGQDMRFVEDNIVMGRKFCNKVWNASRFVISQISNSKLQISDKFQILNHKSQTVADKEILGALNRTIKSVKENLENFRFGKAVQRLYNFFWHDFCDVYIEKFKSQKSTVENQKLLLYVLLTSLKFLHPFIPFVTEEIYQRLPLKNKKQCLMVESWPE